jgi:hypothetical protein
MILKLFKGRSIILDTRKLLRTLTIGQGSILVPHIEAYQDRGVFPPTWDITIVNEKPDDGHFHPSSECLTPVDVLWRQKKGLTPKERIGSSLRRAFDAGHMWHGYFGSILVEMGFVDPKNVERYIIYDIEEGERYCRAAGTGDLVGVNIPGNGEWLVDMKTMNKQTFESGLSPHMLAKYTAQVNCYGDWFGYEKMMILAIEKDSPHRLKEIVIQRDETLLNEIYQRWLYVAECLRQNIPAEINECP